jgi:hypothetical protein
MQKDNICNRAETEMYRSLIIKLVNKKFLRQIYTILNRHSKRAGSPIEQ